MWLSVTIDFSVWTPTVGLLSLRFHFELNAILVNNCICVCVRQTKYGYVWCIAYIGRRWWCQLYVIRAKIPIYWNKKKSEKFSLNKCVKSLWFEWIERLVGRMNCAALHHFLFYNKFSFICFVHSIQFYRSKLLWFGDYWMLDVGSIGIELFSSNEMNCDHLQPLN